MKGVFIKGMQKPESCIDCIFAEWSYDMCKCRLLNKKKIDNGRDYVFGKTSCPIIDTEVVR